jgi:hypothetical protein
VLGSAGPVTFRILIRTPCGTLAGIRGRPPAPAAHCTTPTSRPPPLPGPASLPARSAPRFAVRTDHASLRSVGVLSNRYLIGGIAFALTFAAALIYVPVLNSLFGTAPLTVGQLAIVVPFPFIVWVRMSSGACSCDGTRPGIASGLARSGLKAGNYRPERP